MYREERKWGRDDIYRDVGLNFKRDDYGRDKTYKSFFGAMTLISLMINIVHLPTRCMFTINILVDNIPKVKKFNAKKNNTIM